MKFCHAISLISWTKILLKKKMMRFNCPRVLEWNDSAEEEALYNSNKSKIWHLNRGGKLELWIWCRTSKRFRQVLSILRWRRGLWFCSPYYNCDYPPPCTGWRDVEETIQPIGCITPCSNLSVNRPENVTNDRTVY